MTHVGGVSKGSVNVILYLPVVQPDTGASAKEIPHDDWCTVHVSIPPFIEQLMSPAQILDAPLATPGGPVGHVGPVGPVAPVAPVAPVGPIGPI